MVPFQILSEHNHWLLLLAVAICLVGASAGIRLWNRALGASGGNRLDLVVLASVVLGATIWTAHFVAMLGWGQDSGAIFDPGLTVISAASAMAGAGLAIAVTVLLHGTASHLLAGTLLGLAVSIMHFVGLLGFRPAPGVASADNQGALSRADLWTHEAALIGVAFGIATVRLLDFGTGDRQRGQAATLALATAVAGVHVTAMTIFLDRPTSMPTDGTAGSHTEMAIASALVAMILVWVGISSNLARNRLSDTAAAKLEESARTDPLTGVANREAFNRLLERVCRLRARQGTEFALILVDLDRFKPVNDMFGHAVGDEVLRRAVARLRSILRPTDTIARLGGDEFAVLLTDVGPDDPAIGRTAAQIVDILARPILIEARVIEIGASAGIAVPRTGEDTDAATLCRDADMALYAAKAEGRGAFRQFERGIGQRFEERRRLEYGLRRAVARNEFELFYQPVVDGRTGDFVGAEALLRWQHPTRGLLAPGEFVPLAEEMGLLMQIGKWVIENATQTAMTWQKPLKVSVNVSPLQLRDPRIVRTVQDALHKSGLPPERLDLEITESALLDNEERSIEILHALRQIGVSISLDDFGTGFSALSYLHKFPLDRIKIDRSFVEAAQTNVKSARIVEAISQLGFALGLGVTAEGVETEEQLVMATGHGCDVIQGFLISRPVPNEAFNDLIAAYGGSGQDAERTGS